MGGRSRLIRGGLAPQSVFRRGIQPAYSRQCSSARQYSTVTKPTSIISGESNGAGSSFFGGFSVVPPKYDGRYFATSGMAGMVGMAGNDGSGGRDGIDGNFDGVTEEIGSGGRVLATLTSTAGLTAYATGSVG